MARSIPELRREVVREEIERREMGDVIRVMMLDHSIRTGRLSWRGEEEFTLDEESAIAFAKVSAFLVPEDCYTCGRPVGLEHSDGCPRRAWGEVVLAEQARWTWRASEAQESARIARNRGQQSDPENAAPTVLRGDGGDAVTDILRARAEREG